MRPAAASSISGVRKRITGILLVEVVIRNGRAPALLGFLNTVSRSSAEDDKNSSQAWRPARPGTDESPNT